MGLAFKKELDPDMAFFKKDTIKIEEHTFFQKEVKTAFAMIDQDKPRSSVTTLQDCLQAFKTEEKLSGNDQFYCRRCKTHRDILKKLEVYKIPQIMMIQLRRFTSKKVS